MAAVANVSVAGRKHVPVNPCSHEGAHEGPRGYAPALKDGATFFVLDEHGDINRVGRGHQGLYREDTRHISRLALSIQDAQPVLLYAATRHDNSASARAVLTTLADCQATAVDESSAAEPGKIVHEMHVGEMARLGEVPFHKYYVQIVP